MRTFDIDLRIKRWRTKEKGLLLLCFGGIDFFFFFNRHISLKRLALEGQNMHILRILSRPINWTKNRKIPDFIGTKNILNQNLKCGCRISFVGLNLGDLRLVILVSLSQSSFLSNSNFLSFIILSHLNYTEVIGISQSHPSIFRPCLWRVMSNPFNLSDSLICKLLF